MTRIALAVGLVLACACARSAYREAPWGSAPPALPDEITEVTLHRWQCDTQDRCQRDSVTFRRDGRVSRSIDRQANPQGNTMISPQAFREIVDHLITLGFFTNGDSHPEMEMTMRSVVITAASLCRRKVVSSHDARLGRISAYLDSVISSLRWPTPQLRAAR